MNKFTMIIILFTVLFSSCKQKTKLDKVSMQNSLQQLLNADYKNRGFIIFGGSTDLEYVQYGIEKEGFLLWWPKIDDGKGHTTKDILKVAVVLQNEGFQDFTGDFNNLSFKEYTIDDDGLYSIVGKDIQFIEKLTLSLFDEVYSFSDFENIRTELVLDNN